MIGFCYHECVGISDLADCPDGGVGLTLQAARQEVRSNLFTWLERNDCGGVTQDYDSPLTFHFQLRPYQITKGMKTENSITIKWYVKTL